MHFKLLLNRWTFKYEYEISHFGLNLLVNTNYQDRNVKLISFTKYYLLEGIKTSKHSAMKTFKLTSGHSLCNTTQKTRETIEIHQKTVHHVLYNISTFFFCFIWPACCLIYIHHFLHMSVFAFCKKCLHSKHKPFIFHRLSSFMCDKP